MKITPYHLKYYAYELTRRCPSDSVDKLSSTLLDAQVDLNPHQIEAALFAFQSPLSKGAILAAENAIKDTKNKIKELNRQSKQTQTAQEQLNIQKKLRELTRKQRRQRQFIFDVEDEIADQRDEMINGIEERMMRKVQQKELFTVRWAVV